jgi:hypothetical protein
LAVRLNEDQVRQLRLRGQSLAGPQPGGPGAVGGAGGGPAAAAQAARRVCGLQAQNMFAASLGMRVRSRGATLAGVERARFEERSVVCTWAMRGTLHLLAADDLDWLLPLVGPAFVAAARSRRRQLGLDEDTYQRGVRAVRDRLAANGPSTREELVAAFTAAGVPAGYRTERHLLYRAALEGIICLGPDRGARPAWVLLEDWLGRPLKPAAPEKALAELAARYLAAYAPAAPEDLAAWSGLPAAVVRAAWTAAAGGLAEVTAAGRPAWLPRRRLADLDLPLPNSPAVRLLPAFDTYLLGYRSRELIVEPAHAGHINSGGGMILPVLLVGGRVAGTWKPNRKGRLVNVEVKGFAGLSPEVEAGIAAETADIRRFMGMAAA